MESLFVIGGARLGVPFPGEGLTARKVAGLLLAVAGVYLVAARGADHLCA